MVSLLEPEYMPPDFKENLACVYGIVLLYDSKLEINVFFSLLYEIIRL